jgi:uncharacterized protein YigE (DUF2233 family)
MKKYVAAIIISTLTLGALSSAFASARVEGLHYWQTTTPLKQTVHLIEVDPAKLSIVLAHAKEKALGRETVSAIAKRYKAIAAINGGFFKSGEWVDGLPAGILKIHGQWYGIAYRARGAIGWSTQFHTTLVDRIQTKTNVFLNHKQFPVHAVNQPGLANKSILYTDTYGSKTDSVPDGTNIIIQNNRIIDIQSSGKIAIPKGGYVFAIGPYAKYPNHPIDIGSLATVNIEIIPHFAKKEHYLAWQMVDNVLGGSPILLYHGKIVQDHSMERLRSPFITDRYARTAVGVLKNGHWLFAVVEQSALTGSPGMTIAELAIFMKDLKCEYALNLDGGGSSTLYINNAIINHPGGSDEDDYIWSAVRPVSDAILILPAPVKNEKR